MIGSQYIGSPHQQQEKKIYDERQKRAENAISGDHDRRREEKQARCRLEEKEITGLACGSSQTPWRFPSIGEGGNGPNRRVLVGAMVRYPASCC